MTLMHATLVAALLFAMPALAQTTPQEHDQHHPGTPPAAQSQPTQPVPPAARPAQPQPGQSQPGMGGGMMGGGMMGQGMMGGAMMGGGMMQGGMMGQGMPSQAAPGQGGPQGGTQGTGPGMMQGMMGQGMMCPMMATMMGDGSDMMGGMMNGSAGMMNGGPVLMARIDRIEGRLAFLKTELKITDAQLPLWNAFAAVVRTNVTIHNADLQAMRGGVGADVSLPDRLLAQANAFAVHSDGMAKLKAAVDPLYAALSAEQKKVADEIIFSPMGIPAHMGMM